MVSVKVVTSLYCYQCLIIHKGHRNTQKDTINNKNEGNCHQCPSFANNPLWRVEENRTV